jgi:hypothetical protein
LAFLEVDALEEDGGIAFPKQKGYLYFGQTDEHVPGPALRSCSRITYDKFIPTTRQDLLDVHAIEYSDE